MKNKRITSRSLILTVAFFACILAASAQDTIRFTWWEGNYRMFSISATNNESYIIDWGKDSEIDTIIGTGELQTITHRYNFYNNYYDVIITSMTADCRFTKFFCYYFQRFSSLDVKHCTALEELWCVGRALTVLEVSGCIALSLLDCRANQLTNLDLSTCTALSDLDCSYNQLSSLTLSGCAGLSDLDCSYNQLSSLEVDGCTALGSLDCSSNQLTKLDLSTNTALRTLICDNNQLSVLELASLREITCWENRLQLSDLYKASKMIYESGNTVEMISLGIQKLPSREVFIGDAIDFSAQNQFPMIVFPYNWINTIFTVEKNGILAPQNDYTIFSGIITFKNIGNYTIKMTNTTIISNPFSPAQVVAEFKVRDIADATLAGLTVSAGKLTPVFSPTNLNYTVDADASVFFVTITAIPTNSNATISGDTGLQKLVSGATFFTITVIAEDGVTTQEYNIIVRSYRLHTDATLSNLTISAGKLAPPFRSTTVNYAANVEYEDSLVTITATPTSANAEVSGDGLKRLQVGINSFTITVTAEDGFITSNYRVNLNRLSKTGITNSTQEASTIQIYIDPTHNQLRITNYKLRDEEIEIFDVLGRKQNVVAKYILPSTEATIDISHLQAGIYYIRINNKLNKILKL